MKNTDAPIVVEEIYMTTLENVWKAITELDQMKKWFFEQIKSFEAKEGFETQFVVEIENRKFTHLWKIEEVIPNQKIKYNWRYKEYEGDSFVTFELFENESNVKLRLITEIIHSFQSNVPEFTRESCVGGWEYFVKSSLKEYLMPEK
ncbi:ATPase [Aquimarina atlantica]|uniref:ATPase n=1 Tax=Aquimarina atlantica TaxID=1317122 RepID=A0A023BTD0_9FLAO|nr:SRPBCC domain-containing protein [Aquimarina atlantica]EZH73271.1 ATPase [Aquimarina atlantica]